MKSEQLFFTSDTHFHHRRMVELRGFESKEAMNEEIIHCWNQTIPKDGHVFHLGDVSFGNRVVTESVLARLNGIKYLIYGNHDSSQIRNSKYWQWAVPYYEFKVDDTDQHIVLCHYPFRTWNKSHHGTWNLHGHCHNNLSHIGGQMDVGVDTNHMCPYTYAGVAANMKVRGPYVPVDHHKDNDYEQQ